MSARNEALAQAVELHRKDFMAQMALARRHIELASDFLDANGRADLADEIRDSLEELGEAMESVENDFLRVTPAALSGESA